MAFASGLGYPTPKVDVRAVVFRDEELLLVRERQQLPLDVSGRLGGRGRHARRSRRSARRSRRAATACAAEKLLALLDKSRHEHPPSIDYTYKVLIGCRLEGGEPVTSHEIDAVGFFARAALPELDLDRTTPGQVALAYAHLADPARPTDFD